MLLISLSRLSSPPCPRPARPLPTCTSSSMLPSRPTVPGRPTAAAPLAAASACLTCRPWMRCQRAVSRQGFPADEQRTGVCCCNKFTRCPEPCSCSQRAELPRGAPGAAARPAPWLPHPPPCCPCPRRSPPEHELLQRLVAQHGVPPDKRFALLHKARRVWGGMGGWGGGASGRAGRCRGSCPSCNGQEASSAACHACPFFDRHSPFGVYRPPQGPPRTASRCRSLQAVAPASCLPAHSHTPCPSWPARPPRSALRSRCPMRRSVWPRRLGWWSLGRRWCACACWPSTRPSSPTLRPLVGTSSGGRGVGGTGYPAGAA